MQMIPPPLPPGGNFWVGTRLISLPNTDEIFDKEGNACCFSILDPTKGYFKIAMKEKDMEKMDF